MKTLIIGFSKPAGKIKPFAWLIRLVEGTPYSHVYIRTHSENLNTDIIYQASGIQVNFMGLEHFKNHSVPLYEFEATVDDLTYKSFMRWAINNSGADYSVKQIFGIALVKLFNLDRNPLSDGQKSWVCSELAGYILDSFLDVHISAQTLEIAGPKYIFALCQKFLKPIKIGEI